MEYTSNGQLLDAAEQAGFELLITTDSHLKDQQHLAERNIAILVLRSASWPKIRLRITEVIIAVQNIKRGSMIELEIEASD